MVLCVYHMDVGGGGGEAWTFCAMGYRGTQCTPYSLKVSLNRQITPTKWEKLTYDMFNISFSFFLVALDAICLPADNNNIALELEVLQIDIGSVNSKLIVVLEAFVSQLYVLLR
jgi:hypothetical protein